jgi:small-conductance mechanosensitive channel
MTDVPLAGGLSWSVALAVGFPLLLLTTGELLLRLRTRRSPLVSPVAEIRSVLLPVLATLILLVKVIDLDADAIAVRLVKTLFWLIAVHAVLSFLNALLFAHAKEGSWRSRLPGLFVDLIRVVLWLVGAAIILSTVWGQDLRQLVTALGVGSIVLGLALQEPLGNLFSGIMLMIERPLAIGDRLTIGGAGGVVITTNWRAIHLQTANKDLLVVPNSVLAKQSFINQNRPAKLHRETVILRFSRDDPPNHVKRILLDTALRTRGVLSSPAPQVELEDFAESAVIYAVKIHMASVWDRGPVLDEFRTLVWYAARRHAMTMPFPTQTRIVVDQADLDAARQAPLPPEVTRVFPRFDLANGEIAGRAVSRSAVKYYAKGERIIVAGERLPGIHLILKGEAILTADRLGAEVEIARLEPGGYFGEQSLVPGAASDVNVTAAEDLELLILDSDGLAGMLERTPNLTREITRVVHARRKAVSGLHEPVGGGE